ncbi:hypothetical protein [Nesterenkonia pannonica]|uniref:hypothetical protein n=1 Tax=Nesterenkonia pannonica TaxID=1548602 RepID=UPI0021646B8F|nr:hypothetical protein [Nesterenkonia pannonica]
MTIYHWGDSYPWGTDSMPEPGKLTDQLTGSYDGLGGDDTVFPDFYTEYAVEQGKPMAIPETAAFVSADADDERGLAIRRSWWQQVFSEEVHERFEHIRLISWFNWDKYEAEVDGLVRWSLTTDGATAEAFGADLPDWVLTSDDLEPQGP